MSIQPASDAHDGHAPANATQGTVGRSLGLSCGGDLMVAPHSSDGLLVVALYGALGPESRRGLYSALNAAFMAQPLRLVIDASFVTECDRRGLATFIDAAERALACGIPMAMGGLALRQQQTLQQLWRAPVTEQLSYPSVACAIAAVKDQPTAREPSREELLDDVQHLLDALDASRGIEQARGVLMAIYGLTADAAFDSLRCHAQSHNLELRVVAERLIAVVQRSPAGTAPNLGLDALMDHVAGPPSLLDDSRDAVPTRLADSNFQKKVRERYSANAGTAT